MNNGDVAIMNKLIELMERYDVHPCAPIVALHESEQPPYHTRLAFETPPQDAAEEERFFNLMTSLGLDGINKSEIVGSDREIYDKLQAALKRAPNPRRR